MYFPPLSYFSSNSISLAVQNPNASRAQFPRVFSKKEERERKKKILFRHLSWVWLKGRRAWFGNDLFFLLGSFCVSIFLRKALKAWSWSGRMWERLREREREREGGTFLGGMCEKDVMGKMQIFCQNQNNFDVKRYFAGRRINKKLEKRITKNLEN